MLLCYFVFQLVEQVLIRAKDPAKLPESFAKTLHHLSQAIVRNQQQLSHMLLDGQGNYISHYEVYHFNPLLGTATQNVCM